MPGTRIEPHEIGFSDHAMLRCFEMDLDPLEVAAALNLPHYAQRQATDGTWDPSAVRMAHYVRVSATPVRVVVGDNHHDPDVPFTVITIAPLVGKGRGIREASDVSDR